MMAERRRHPRTFTKADLSGRSGYNAALRLIDVSAKGACLVTTGRLRPGSAMSLELDAPSTKERLNLKALVRWSTTVESRGRVAHVAGLEFDRPVSSLGPRRTAAVPLHAAGTDPQRRHKRFHPPAVELSCLPKGILRALGLTKNAAKGLKDLSLGGAQIVSERRMKPGERMDLTLAFRYPDLAVQAEAVVRWCRRDTLSLEPRWFVGVVFKRVDPDSDSRLKTVEAFFAGAR
jgi:hypothetical protein